MVLDQRRCKLQDSNRRLRSEMICLFPIRYYDFQNNTWSGTELLANSCRNCSVNSPMGVKREFQSGGPAFYRRNRICCVFLRTPFRGLSILSADPAVVPSSQKQEPGHCEVPDYTITYSRTGSPPQWAVTNRHILPAVPD